MTDPLLLDKRKNKKFVIDNKFILRKYALQNQQKFGKGIIVINLLLLDTDILDEEDIKNSETEDEKEITLQQPLSYIPEKNFWFKMLYLKIKKKHQIDIKKDYDFSQQSLVIFVKDASVEYFSIYSLKLESSKKATS